MELKTALVAATASIALALSGAAHAATVVFDSTFENLPGGPTPGTFTTPATADGWTGGDFAGGDNHGIELQNNVAGAPAADGGAVFVELDTDQNSSMSRTIGAGTYQLSFLYSPRPGNPATSNGIEVFLNGVELAPPGLLALAGGATTQWSTISVPTFTAKAGDVLTFSAEGTSDSLGGYVDNITLSAVPEPATWAVMLMGFGGLGVAMRSRRRQAQTA
jgi:hypothetical protein